MAICFCRFFWFGFACGPKTNCHLHWFCASGQDVKGWAMGFLFNFGKKARLTGSKCPPTAKPRPLCKIEGPAFSARRLFCRSSICCSLLMFPQPSLICVFCPACFFCGKTAPRKVSAVPMKACFQSQRRSNFSKVTPRNGNVNGCWSFVDKKQAGQKTVLSGRGTIGRLVAG